MRIISGTLKGRKLNSWDGKLPVRPMTDKMKEMVFNVLAPYFFEDCLFLDLFSGTGSLALEALSRGAKQAHAVEKHPLCVRIIKQNSKMLPDPKRLILHKKNVFSYLRKAQKYKPDAPSFDFIVVDPPFALNAGEAIMRNLQSSFLTAKGTVIAIETGKREDLKNSYHDFYLFSKKMFNDKKVWFYEFR